MMDASEHEKSKAVSSDQTHSQSAVSEPAGFCPAGKDPKPPTDAWYDWWQVDLAKAQMKHVSGLRVSVNTAYACGTIATTARNGERVLQWLKTIARTDREAQLMFLHLRCSAVMAYERAVRWAECRARLAADERDVDEEAMRDDPQPASNQPEAAARDDSRSAPQPQGV